MPWAQGRFVDLRWSVCYGSPVVGDWRKEAERTNGF